MTSAGDPRHSSGEGNTEIDRTNEPENSVTTKFSDLFDIFHTFESEEKARIFQAEVDAIEAEFMNI